MNIQSFVVISVVAVLSVGCGSNPQKSVDEQVVERSKSMVSVPAFSGKTVALDLALYQRVTKDQAVAGEPIPANEVEYVLRPVERVPDDKLYSNGLIADVRLNFRTNEQLDFFEKYFLSFIERSGGRLVSGAEPADLTIKAKMVYGPMPAPAYRDYNVAKSAALGIVTLGLGPRSYSAVVDYEIDLSLMKSESLVLQHSNLVKKDDEQIKSQFNIGGREEVRDVALETFRGSIEEQAAEFARRVNATCKSGC